MLVMVGVKKKEDVTVFYRSRRKREKGHHFHEIIVNNSDLKTPWLLFCCEMFFFAEVAV